METGEILRAGVLGVYRCLMRHSRRLDESLAKKIRGQFKRRKAYAGIGHIRAAYELEGQLRAVHRGETTLKEVQEKWTTKKSTNVEQNSLGRHMIWSLQPERRWDRYNYPPADPARVRAHSKVANLRANYLRHFGIQGLDVDLAVVDTVFAPEWQNDRKRATRQRSLEREKTPRQVSVHTMIRTGGELSVLRIQGKKPWHRGFRKVVNSVSRGGSEGEKYLKLEVQRRVLINRAPQLQRKLNYRFERRPSHDSDKNKAAVRLTEFLRAR